MMLASGSSSVITRLVGSTTSELGAIPMLHIMFAPIQTCIGISEPSASWLPGHSSKARRECNAWRAVVCQCGSVEKNQQHRGESLLLPRMNLSDLESAVQHPTIDDKINGDEGKPSGRGGYGQDESNFRHVAHRSTKVVARN